MRKAFLLLFVAAWAGVAAASPAPGEFITHGPRKGKRVALTFDDGPGPYTERVLEILKRSGVRATFFMNGDQVATRPKLARKVFEAGHEIGDHTYNHIDFHTYDREDKADRLRQEMRLSKKAIQKAVGTTPKLCRMPYGFVRPWVREIARHEGYALVNWTFGNDWHSIEPEAKRRDYLKAIRPGAIFLMHDGGARRQGTLFVLEGLLEELKRQGYEAVTVGELLGRHPEESR